MPSTRSTTSPYRLVPRRGVGPEVAWTAEQRRVIDHERGPLLVLGGPGTGKTACLRQAAIVCARRTGGAAVLVLVASRAEAEQARAAIAEAAPDVAAAISVMTIHGLALAIVRAGADPDEGTPWLLNAAEQDAQIRDLLALEPATAWPSHYAAAYGTEAFETAVRETIARLQRAGIGPEELGHGDSALHGHGTSVARQAGHYGDDEAGWASLGRFYATYLDVLALENALDYQELLIRARALVAERGVAACLGATPAMVYVDAYEEIDPAQAALVAAVVAPGNDVVGFADPDQAVDVFRGTDVRSSLSFLDDFAAETAEPGFSRDAAEPGRGRPAASPVVLGTSWRLTPAIGAATRALAARIPLVGPQAGVSAAYRAVVAAAGPDRPVEALAYGSEAEQAAGIAQVLRHAHVVDGRPWRDMALVVRTKEQAGLAQRALTRLDVPAVVDGAGVVLAQQPAVRVLVAALTLTFDGLTEQARGGHENSPLHDHVTNPLAMVLGSPLCGLAPATGRRLLACVSGQNQGRSTRQSAIVTWETLLAAADVARLDDAERERLTTCGRVAAEATRRHERGGSLAEIAWCWWSGTSWPERLVAAASQPTVEGRRANGDLDAVLGFFRALDGRGYGMWARSGESSRAATQPAAEAFDALLARWAGSDVPEDLAETAAVDAVHVVTAHRTKGRTWPLVVVAGLEEGVWPAPRRGPALFDPAWIGVSATGTPSALASHVAAERRLAYLALTRASERLVVTTVAGEEGDRPSRFLVEAGIVPARAAVDDDPIASAEHLVTRLRTVGDDETAHPALRRAAVERLAALAQGAAGRRAADLADPRSWWGVAQSSGEIAPAPTDRSSTGGVIAQPSLEQASKNPSPDAAMRASGLVPRLSGTSTAQSSQGIAPGSPSPENAVAASALVPRLSGSTARSLLDCPRQWFLTHEARASSFTGGATFGSLVHTLVQLRAEETLARDDVGRRIDEAWSLVPQQAAWKAAWERDEAMAAMARYEEWARTSRRSLVACEVPFDVVIPLGRADRHGLGETMKPAAVVDAAVPPRSVGGDDPGRRSCRLVGCVDRVDVDEDGRVWIVDFKTSLRQVSQPAVDAHVQLGVYQVAFLAGGLDAACPPGAELGGAELVSLRHDEKVGSALPKRWAQGSLRQFPYLASPTGYGALDAATAERIGPQENHPSWVHHQLAVAVETFAGGRFPATPGAACTWCPVPSSCPAPQMTRGR